MAERADARPILVMACLNFSRSSALSMALVAPIISQCRAFEARRLRQIQSAVQRRLPAHRGQERVGFSFSMIFSTMRQVIGSMGHVRHIRVGHDRGRIRN